MKITKVHAYLRHVALKKPYTIANYTFADVSFVFLEIHLANGLVGHGSGSFEEGVDGKGGTAGAAAACRQLAAVLTSAASKDAARSVGAKSGSATLTQRNAA
jgi:L-alanine-DL-glutamate epimerase-like enolase superfamily enzyme